MALPKKNRFYTNKDFDNIFKNGKAKKGRFLLIKTLDFSKDDPRVGFIVPIKVVKKAVNRNKIKRIMSEAVQKNFDLVKKDIIVLLLKRPSNLKEEKDILQKEIIELIKKNG